MEEGNTKKIYELGIFIPLVSTFAIASVYYYEDGFFYQLGIPNELIQIELSKNIKLIFGFIAYSIVFMPFLFDIIIKSKDYKFFKTKVGVILWLPLTTGIFYSIFSKVVSWHTAPLVLCTLFGWVFSLSNRAIETKSKSDLDFYETISSLTLGLLGPFLIASSVICLFFFLMGYNSGDDLNRFFSKADKKTFLLRKYSEFTIYGVTDSIGKPFKEFIISKGTHESDTIIAKPKH